MIADFLGAVEDPAGLAVELDAIAGVIDHGLFPPSLVSDVIVGRDGRAEHADLASG